MAGSTIAFIGGAIILMGTTLTLWGSHVSNRETDAKDRRVNELLEMNASLSRQMKDFATGADSYVFLHVKDFGTAKARAEIGYRGTQPVRDILMVVYDVTDQIPDIANGKKNGYSLEAAPNEQRTTDTSIYPHGTVLQLISFPFETNPTEEFYSYFIRIYSNTGFIRQQLQLQKANGEWRQAYVIDSVTSDRIEPRSEYFDAGFPTGEKGKLKLRRTPKKREEAMLALDENTATDDLAGK